MPNMKCYYEELNVPRDADDTEIKSAYKKLALRWHPDKNLADPEGAKEQFQLVHQAYEVLSDRQERAWYDNHREQILRGGNKDYEDNCLDVFQYFTSSCYKGFGDDDNGFYTIYHNVFDQIAKEDLEHMDCKEEFCSIPMFGASGSDYEATVRPFYAYWMSYSTKRSYVWLDPYDIRETRERRVLKFIEKENKKVRAKAKKERNEEVRNLVAFVRKRDRRVQANIKLMEQKALENKQKAEEIAKQARIDRRAESKKQVQAEWAKFDNVQDELEIIEKQLADEFHDRDDNGQESEEDDFYCVACNKVFKTVKAFANHETSKKHKENIEHLRAEMLEEENEYETIEDGEITDEEIEAEDNQWEQGRIIMQTDGSHIAEELLATEDDILEEPVKVKKKKNKKNRQGLNTTPSGDDDGLEEPRKNRKTQNKLHERTTNGILNISEREIGVGGTVDENNDDDTTNELSSVHTSQNTKKPKRRKAKVSTQATSAPSVVPADMDLEHTCVTCRSVFSSKNKLFDHLKKTGHGVYLPAASTSKKKGKRGSERNDGNKRA